MNNFQRFSEYSGINQPGIFSDSEERHTARYTLKEFKNVIKQELYESEGYVDEELIKEAYMYYEMASFTDSKGDWTSGKENIMSLDAGENVILIKNNEAYVISKSTFDSVNEDWSFASAKNAFNTLRAKASSTIDSMSAGAKKAWDGLSDGAKKAWEFVKTIPSVVTKLVKGMSWKEWTSLTLGVISALTGLVGAGIPGVTILGGVSLSLLGAMDIWEGWEKYHEASKKLGKIDLGDGAKNSAIMVSALPQIATGTILLSLGIKDVLEGSSTALVNPAAGSVALAIKNTALKASNNIIASMGHNMTHMASGFIKKVVEKITKNPKLASKVPGVAGRIAVIVLGNVVLGKCLDWLFKGIMKGAKLLTSAFNFLLDIPAKISQGIETFRSKATSPIAKIVGSGLGNLVKPLTDSASKMINKYIKPMLDGVRKFIDFQILTYDLCQETLKEEEKKPETKKIPVAKIPATKGKPIINTKKEPQKATSKDLGLVKQIKGIKEGIETRNVYNFDQFLRFG